MRSAATIVLAAVSALLFSLSSSTTWAQPEVTLIYPQDGAVLDRPPANIHLCFAQPVDNADDADFQFRVLMPEGRGLGLRIVFQSDGLGVDVQPGIPDAPLEGEWTFEWRVSDDVTKAPASGTVHFQVRPDGSPVSSDPPAPCTGTGSATQAAVTTADDEGGGSDTLTVVLIVAGFLGAAAVVLILLFLRPRLGAQRPPGGDGQDPPA